MKDNARDLLVFEHIPKTAGSTMHAILWRVYGGKQRVFMATVRGRHAEHLAALRRRLDDPQCRLKAIISHVGYGWHELLPGDHRYTHYTFLRDPVERVLSHYYFQIQRGQLDPSTSLETFVREDLSRSCNVQTAFLGGLEWRHNLEGITLSLDRYTEALLEQAKANLHRMAAIGLTERFDESLLLLKNVFGWQWTRIFYVRRRVGALRRQHPEASDQARALIRRYNALDLALYDYAQDLFERQLAAHFPDGPPNVKTFRRLNAAFNLAYPLARPVVHKARALKEAWTS